MSRPRKVAIAAFVVLVAGSPFLPRDGGDEPRLRPAAQQPVPAATAGLGRLTTELTGEIDRVLAEGSAVSGISARRDPGALAAALVRCADFEGQRYCLHAGWTDRTEEQVQARMAVAARSAAGPTSPVERTGDLDPAYALRRAAALPPEQRAAAERAELTLAARSVAKVWLLRHQVEGLPLPEGFLERHPEATAAPAAPAARARSNDGYPDRKVILRPRRVAEQERTYWCGPATMQMIAWGWKGFDKGQAFWASKLGTTTEGTAISQMVEVINASTGWDRRDRAGAYITLDIGDYSFGNWMELHKRHLVEYRAPLVLHPVLLQQYYPYLDDDASGHFQVGRGYDKRGSRPTAISYFEPWNQQRFDPSEPYIARVQWRNAYRSYRANQAHSQHNIGV